MNKQFHYFSTAYFKKTPGEEWAALLIYLHTYKETTIKNIH
jgi:hypothetical protein